MSSYFIFFCSSCGERIKAIQDLGKFICSNCRQEYLATPGFVYRNNGHGSLTRLGCSLTQDNLEDLPEVDNSLEETMDLDKREIKKYPEDVEACLDLAYHLGGDEEIAVLRHAVNIAPERADTRLYLGESLLKQGHLEEAERALHQAIKKKPDMGWAYFCLGKVLEEQDRLAEAEGAFRQGIKVCPQSSETYLELGLLLDAKGRLKEAEAAYRQSIEIRHNPSAFAYLSMLCFGDGRKEEALEAYGQAVELDERFGNEMFYRGHQMERKGMKKEAKEAFRQAREEDYQIFEN
jgi:tetratricopeptide (TPR) repeat protein